MKFSTALTILSSLSWSNQSSAFSTAFTPSRQTTIGNRLYSSTLTKEEITSVNGIATNEEKQDTTTVTIATPTATAVAVAVDSVTETETKPVTVTATATPRPADNSATTTTTTTTNVPPVAKTDKNKIQP
jgi:hypothetical protein